MEVNEPNVEGLINELNNSTGEAPDTTPPQKIGDIDFASFEKSLVEATGGKFKNYGEMQNAIKRLESLSEIESKYSQLEQQSKQSPFSNDFVKKINDMYQSGASDNEIERFFKLQRVNVAEMSNVDKIRQQYQFQFPEMSVEQIDGLIEEKYGTTNTEEMSAAKSAQLLIDAKDAEAKLKEMIVESGQSESVRKTQATQEAFKKQAEGWGRVLQSSKALFDKVNLEFEIDKDKKMSIGFDVPAEAKGQYMMQLINTAASNGMPFTKDTFKQLQSQYESMVMAFHWKDVMTQMLKSAVVDVKKQVAGAQGGFPQFLNKGKNEEPPKEQNNNNNKQQSGIKSFLNRNNQR
jgi:hypothetical protein